MPVHDLDDRRVARAVGHRIWHCSSCRTHRKWYDGTRPWLPEGFAFLSGLPEAARRRRKLMPVQAFVDDSGGKGHSLFFVLAGLIADSEDWAAFSEQWSKCLALSPPIKRFKMREAAGCSGEFYNWRADARDDKLRALCRIINQHARLLTYTIIDLNALAETWARHSWTFSNDPYFWPFQNTIMNACFSLWDIGLRERFEIIFDENVIFGPRAKVWYPAIRQLVQLREPDAHRIMPIDPMFRSDDEFLPLQAADLFAWLLRNGFDNPKNRPFPWILDELSLIQETEYSQFYDKERMEAVLADARRQSCDGFVTREIMDKFREIGRKR
jgi:hypothetical protein